MVMRRDGHVRISVDSGVGRLTLNRPEVLNALTPDMVTTMRLWLERWRADAGVRVVVIDGAGQHGLSAGRDVRELYDDARVGGQRSVSQWADEHRLVAEIARHTKPVVALMDGIVMGSGVGIAAHASHRIVTDETVVALPEIGVGMVPGMGATYLLARAPGEVGTHLALTGDRMDAADALFCGIADWCIPREQRSTLMAALADTDTDVDHVLDDLCVTPAYGSELRGHRSWIDACYSADRVEDVLHALGTSAGGGARVAADRIAELSPTGLKVVLRALREARSDAGVEDALRRELRVAARLIAGPDVREGIRALAVDRDMAPTWVPSTLEAVSPSDVDAHFAPLGVRELDLDTLPRPS
jgi:enoyl-CoA hydratase